MFKSCRIVCDMEESLMSSPPGGPVELCIGDCSAEYRTQSSQTYSFVVRLICLVLFQKAVALKNPNLYFLRR